LGNETVKYIRACRSGGFLNLVVYDTVCLQVKY
jgi:hypothetical protein